MGYKIIDGIKVPAASAPLVEAGDDMFLFGEQHIKEGLIPIPKKYMFLEAPADMLYLKETVYTPTMNANADVEIPVANNTLFTLVKDTDDNFANIRYESPSKSKSIINGIAVRDVASGYTPISIVYKGVGYDIVKTRGQYNGYIFLNYVPTTSGAAPTAIAASLQFHDYLFLDEDATYVYFVALGPNGISAIVKYTKGTTTAATSITTVSSLNLLTGPKASFIVKNKCLKPYIDGTKKYIPVLYTNASNEVILRVLIYDSSISGTDIATKVTYADYTMTGSITLPVSAVTTFEYWFRDDGVLVIGVVKQGIAISMGTTTIDQYGVYTLTVDHTAKTAVINGFTQSNNICPIHIIFNGDLMYGVSQYSYSTLEYDSVAKKYIKTNEITTNHTSLGIDTRGFIWFYDLYNNLEVHTPSMVRKVSCIAAKTQLRSNTFPVDLSYKVSASNASGERLAKTMKLSIYGPGVFKSNGLKTVEIITSETADTEVVVSVTGKGNLEVIPEVSGEII